MLSDKILIENTLQGDQNAFKQLVLKYQDYMYTVCFNILKNKPEAQEATQDTFVKAYRALSTYSSQAKFSTWLYRIAYRTSLDILRKRKDTVTLDGVAYGLSNKEVSIEDRLEGQALKEQLRQAIFRLPSKEAGIIKMFYLDDMNIKELAVATDQSISNVKVILYRARKKLSKIISEQYPEMKNYINS